MFFGSGSSSPTNSPMFGRGGSPNSISSMLNKEARWGSLYPSQLFDPIAFQTIVDPKSMILWSRFFYEWHPIVHAAVNSMAAYPITDFVVETESAEVRERYLQAFQTLKVKEKLVQFGIDYHMSGNAFCTILPPFKRMISCPACEKSTETIESATIKMVKDNLSYTCASCGVTSVNPPMTEFKSKSVEDMKLVLWDPLSVSIDYDEVTATSSYNYNIPAQAVDGIKKGEKKYLGTYPKSFLTAAREGKDIQFTKESIIHSRRPSHSSAHYKGWGPTIISSSFKQLFHLLLMMKAQDSIMIDQLMPWKVFSPAQSGGMDIVEDQDLGTWKGQVQSEYSAWRKDPTRTSIMPIPMQTQFVGGNGKGMMLHPEMTQLLDQILAGMGVPHEFVYGGLSYSGASISLRMLENKFLWYRTEVHNLMDRITAILQSNLGFPKATVRLLDFKMADDVAQKNFILSMVEGTLISKQTALEQLFPQMDYRKEQERINEETLKAASLTAKSEQRLSKTMPGYGPLGVPEEAFMTPGGEGGGAAAAGPTGDLPEQRPPRAEGANKQI